MARQMTHDNTAVPLTDQKAELSIGVKRLRQDIAGFPRTAQIPCLPIVAARDMTFATLLALVAAGDDR